MEESQVQFPSDSSSQADLHAYSSLGGLPASLPPVGTVFLPFLQVCTSADKAFFSFTKYCRRSLTHQAGEGIGGTEAVLFFFSEFCPFEHCPILHLANGRQKLFRKLLVSL